MFSLVHHAPTLLYNVLFDTSTFCVTDHEDKQLCIFLTSPVVPPSQVQLFTILSRLSDEEVQESEFPQ